MNSEIEIFRKKKTPESNDLELEIFTLKNDNIFRIE